MNFGHRREWRSGEKEILSKQKTDFLSVDTLAYFVSLLSLVFTLDQVRIVWVEHEVSGISLLSWVFYTISAFVWFYYGVVHKDKVLVVTNVLWTVFSLFVVVGILIFGR